MKNDLSSQDEHAGSNGELDPGKLDPGELAQADALEAMLGRGQSEPGSDQKESEEALAGLIGRVRSVYCADHGGADHGGADYGCDDYGRGDAKREMGGPRSADAFQAERVAQRVLAQTTREDLRRRADLGVLLRFAGDRLRDSAVLRVAAALLIVQLTIVPLVAWHMLKTPHSGILQTRIEPSAQELAKALEDLPQDELTSDLGEDIAALGTSLDQEALEEGAAEAADALGAVLLRLPPDLVPTTSAGRALAAMTLLASRENCTAADTELVGLLGMPDGPFESIVVAESRLYLLACGGGWDGLLEALDHLTVTSGAMAARTVRRAAIMGVAISDLGESLVEAAGHGWQRGGTDWLIELGRGLEAEALELDSKGDPYVAAWLAAIVQDS